MMFFKNAYKEYTHTFFQSVSCCILCLCAVGLTACGGNTPPIRPGTPLIQQGVVQDLWDFPQDLTVYAKRAGATKALLTKQEQEQHNTRFDRIYFTPWHMQRGSFSLATFKNTLKPRQGYMGVEAWTEKDWHTVHYNAHVDAYPARKNHAITVRQTMLRALPSMMPLYSKPTPNIQHNPFDNAQYSTLAPGMPLFVNHVSRDGLWYFIETPMSAGWVRVLDVALVDEAFIKQYTAHPLAALIKDNVSLIVSQGEQKDRTLGTAHVGAVFPLAVSPTKTYTDSDAIDVFVPVHTATGYAAVRTVRLQASTAVQKPWPINAARLAAVGNTMMAQPYGWGGTHGDRDCSSAVRDMFVPFGIWLPRNSLSQYRTGRIIDYKDYSLKEKESVIVQQGVPFMTLVWLPGHISLYVGQYKGKAAIFHNVWGVRVQEAEGEDGRHVIGRAVVTSLEMGKELPNIVQDGTLLSRTQGISIIVEP